MTRHILLIDLFFLAFSNDHAPENGLVGRFVFHAHKPLDFRVHSMHIYVQRHPALGRKMPLHDIVQPRHMEGNMRPTNPARERATPLAVNYHLIGHCNARCAFCFAPFRGRKNPGFADRARLIDAMVDAGVSKINFAGGEPTLVRGLGALFRRAKERSDGECAATIVTNGKRLRELLAEAAPWIDAVALSLDSGSDEINARLGRTRPGIPYASEMKDLAELVHRNGVRLELNTVVTRLNADENMSDLVREMAPERWKLFQMLPVAGENDSAIGVLEISAREFEAYVERHRRCARFGIDVVPESNELMTNSYLMIGPDGRFFWHEPTGDSRRLEYGAPILEVGFDAALEQARFSEDKFVERGGIWDWARAGKATPHPAS